MSLPDFLSGIETEGLGDEYLNAPVVGQQKSLGGMVKQLVDLDRQRGEMIRVPGPDADDEAWNGTVEKLSGKGVFKSEAVRKAFMRDLGVPEKSDDYDLKPENIPDGLQWEDSLADRWKQTFHENGIPQAAGKKLIESFLAGEADKGKAAIEAEEKRQAAIDEAFGQAKEQKLMAVYNAAGAYGDEQAVEFMKSAPAPILQMMAKMADQFNVTGDGDFDSKGEKMMLSPDEAEARLAEIDKKLMDSSVVGDERKRLIAESEKMMNYAMGQKPKRLVSVR